MKHALLFVLPILAAAAAVALPDATPEELVKKLGSEEYETREQATKDLIAMGEKAVPALKAALESDDLEVSLRAGRALRAIEGTKSRAGAAEGREGGKLPGEPGATTSSQVSVEMRDGKVKVRRKVVENGVETEQEYEGESLEQLKRDHPELKDALGDLDVRTRTGRDPLDAEDFWRDWGGQLNDDFWKRWHEDMQRDMDRIRRWQEEMRQRRGGESPFPERGAASRTDALLGIQASAPDQVLDAQLDLQGKGMVVREVRKGTLAERLGMQRFDVLVSLNGYEIEGRDDVVQALKDRKEGDKAIAVVIRHAKRVDLATP